MSVFVIRHMEALADGLLSTPCKTVTPSSESPSGLLSTQCIMIYGVLTGMYPSVSQQQMNDMNHVVQKLIAEAIKSSELVWIHSPISRTYRRQDSYKVNCLTEKLILLLTPYFEHINGKFHEIDCHVATEAIIASNPWC